MSEKELREALLRLPWRWIKWDPGDVYEPGHSQEGAPGRSADGHRPALDREAVLASIPAEPEQADAAAGLDEDLDWAWAIIAKAGGGNWELERPEWRAAAEHWRDQVLPDLSARRAARLAARLAARDDTSGGAS